MNRPTLIPPAPPAAAPSPTDRPRTRKPLRYRWGLWIPLLVLSGLALGGSYLAAKTLSVTHGNQPTTVLQQLGRLFAARDRQLPGEARDRINVLLLGIGGPGHDGPYLADTIVLASIKPSTHEIALLSIPRDLAVELPGGYGFRKINSADAYGTDLKYPGGGEQLSADIVAEITGVPIDYYARVDFSAFQQIIDTVGGVDVTVDHSFVDNEYPNNTYGYMTVRFAAGPTHMNGATALEFARSRHGTNGEGSDFARSARQEKILLALRAKALSAGTLLNPAKVTSIISAVSNHAQTDMELWEMLRLASLVRDIPSGNIVNRVLDSSANGPLKVTTGQDGAFLLVPRAGLQDYTDIQSIAQNIFTVGRVENEKATVVVLNASGIRGVAEKEGQSLGILNYDIVRTGTAAVKMPGQNVLVDFSGGAKPYTVAALAERYGALVTTAVPASVDPTAREYKLADAPGQTGRADLLLILGREPAAGTAAPQQTSSL